MKLNHLIKKLTRERHSIIFMLLLFFSLGSVFANTSNTPKSIEGVVISKTTGEKIAGAVVRIKGSNDAIFTNEDGFFELKASEGDILVISFLGFYPEEIHIKNQNKLSVALIESETKMNEVVVVGYGSQRKSDLTGAIGVVNMNDLSKASVTSFDQALAGRIAGVQVLNTTGQPGSTSTMVIRGGNSITQSNAPLYVVDGMPIESLDDIALAPSDIESMTVLKDASSTAIYGTRGANGVILINTKQPVSSEKVRVNYESHLGVNRVTKRLKMMNPYEFVRYQLDVKEDNAKGMYLGNDKTLDDYHNESGIDWQDELFRNAFYHQHNLSISGGQAVRYNATLSLQDQEGVVINSGLKKTQGRLNLMHDTKRVKIYAGLSYTDSSSKGEISAAPQNQVFRSYYLFRTWAYRPVGGLYQGDLLNDFIDEESAMLNTNPIIDLNHIHKKSFSKIFMANATLDFLITKDLTFKVRGAYTGRTVREESFYNSSTSRGTSLISTNTKGVNGAVMQREFNNLLNENTLTYKKDFNKKHKLEALVGITYQQNKYSSYGLTGENLPNESLKMSGLKEGIPGANNSYLGENRLLSYLARANYNYDNKYLLTASLRADGSSRFDSKNRWAYFPSAALAWRITSEPFYPQNDIIEDAKLRIGYGVTGNDRMNDYARYAQMTAPNAYQYSFGNSLPSKGMIVTNIGNPNLKWESTHQVNLGLDISALKNRVNITADIYYKKTNDLLLNSRIPYTTGFATTMKNIGSVSNKGLELTLSTINIQTKDFTWSSNFNIAFNKNKVLSLAEGETALFSSTNWTGLYKDVSLHAASIGQSMGMFYGLLWDGVYNYEDFNKLSDGSYLLKPEIPANGDPRENIQPGDIKYKDINNDGTITMEDNVLLGSGLPKHTGGFSNEFTYKNFTFNFLLQWSYGNKVMNANRIYLEGNIDNSVGMNQLDSYKNRWTPENTNTSLYRTGGQGPKGFYSDRTLEDGSYLRLKSIQLAYAFPQKITQALGARKIEVYVSAQNLLTWTNYTGMDPEASLTNTTASPGLDFSVYPHAKTTVFGIKANF